MAPEAANASDLGTNTNTHIPTLYDDTLRAPNPSAYTMQTMGSLANLRGVLEHHSPQSDGIVKICLAGGRGVIISKARLLSALEVVALWSSIPAPHRPELSNTYAGLTIPTLVGSPLTALGTCIIPLLLQDLDTGKQFRVKFLAAVVPSLLTDMFVGREGLVPSEQWGGGGVVFDFEFNGVKVRVKGQLP